MPYVILEDGTRKWVSDAESKQTAASNARVADTRNVEGFRIGRPLTSDTVTQARQAAGIDRVSDDEAQQRDAVESLRRQKFVNQNPETVMRNDPTPQTGRAAEARQVVADRAMQQKQQAAKLAYDRELALKAEPNRIAGEFDLRREKTQQRWETARAAIDRLGQTVGDLLQRQFTAGQNRMTQQGLDRRAQLGAQTDIEVARIREQGLGQRAESGDREAASNAVASIDSEIADLKIRMARSAYTEEVNAIQDKIALLESRKAKLQNMDGGGMVRMTNGTETLDVPESDVQAAMADGFKRVSQ